uniref:Uncharacterized protein n=1 Tax=Anopheles albimanus TaxID=7167 RepID=A0A182FGI4_ANOAL
MSHTTNFANHQSTSTSTERSIEPGSDIARNVGPAVTSTTSTTAKPSPKRQISLAEFQKLVAKVNDEIQLLRNQSITLSRTYDDLVQRYNERTSQLPIQEDDATTGTTPDQILTTTVVPRVSFADNPYPQPIVNDHQQPSYLTNICGNNYYNYIHYHMHPYTEDQMNPVASQQVQNREGSIVHQLTPGRHPTEPARELDQQYGSAASSDSWQAASFRPQNAVSLGEKDVPPSVATPSPARSTPQLLEEFLARHKITLDPVTTNAPIPRTTTPIPLEKVLAVEHPPHLVLAIPTTIKPLPGRSHNGWDGFDFQFVRKAMENKRRAEAAGVPERFD